jgi:sugar phosphate isomerase/epimerase
MGLALSASWNAFRARNAHDLIFEIKELGFEEIELSFNLSAPLVDEIEKLSKSNQAKVTSLHNFCPMPEGIDPKDALPDCYSMASNDEKERSLAVQFTKRSIDTAARLGAKAVILHCGRVEVPDRTRELINLYAAAGGDTERFKRLRLDMIKERKETHKPFLENALKSLTEINSHAVGKKITLGIETRFYYYEIPSLQELGLILDTFKGSSLGYWHDTGHAQVMENLGFARHKDYLDLYGSRLLGIHLHDLSGCSDHMAPGKGELDFKMVEPYLKKETLKVIETHSPATAQDLKEGKKLLEEIIDGKL